MLDSVDLQIEGSEFVAIVGKSGSGKSTLISLLSGLDLPSSGEIECGGVRLDRMTEEALVSFRRDQVGFIFQNFHLIPSLTALENVMIPAQLAGRKEAESRARKLLDRVGMSSRCEHLPSQMSGGEQQRVSVCRALVNQPPYIFADEPTGNLDSQSADEVMRIIQEVREGRTLVLVTHDEELAGQADRCIEIKDGRI